MYDYRELARAAWLHFADHYRQVKAAEQAHDENRRVRIRDVPAVTAAAVHDKVLENEMPRLFGSCRKMLNELNKRYFLVLFASGNKRLQTKVVRHHRLEKYFDMVVIRKAKNVSAFREVKALAIDAFIRKLGRRPRQFVMVGDRISQDIAPARKAGFETIWIPGPYFPGNGNDGKPAYQIKKLHELSGILLAKDERNVSSISRRDLARRVEGR
jgi:FMN phosphatase YigB (HAD superfamily)